MKEYLIEDYTPFSESVMWDLQRHFFNDQGIDAWNQQVPYYVTSNMLIAQQYASVLIGYVQDVIQSDPEKAKSPFYFLELGAGTGKFSYYIIKYLVETWKTLGMHDIKFTYIMSDISDKNKEYWLDHESLKPYFTSGYLDCAIVDIENPDDNIYCYASNKTLTQRDFINPLCIIGNYVFDGVRNDCFHINSHTMKEVKVKTISKEILDPSDKGALSKCDFVFENVDIEKNHYENDLFNQILAHYQQELSHTTILFPVASCRFIDHMKHLSNQNLCILSGDKGHQHLSDLKGLVKPHIAKHGSVSLMVNFNAISEYIKSQEGEHLVSDITHSFKVNLFSLGNITLKHAKVAFNTQINSLSAGNFLSIKSTLCKHTKDKSLVDLLGIIQMSRFDPDIYFTIYDNITSQLHEASEKDIKSTKMCLDHVRDNYYLLPFGKNVLFGLGNNYYMIQDFKGAIEAYLLSMQYFDIDYSITFNVGLCFYFLMDLKNALHYFLKAQELDDTESVREWISNTQKEIDSHNE